MIFYWLFSPSTAWLFFLLHRFLQAVDQKVAQLKELINSKRQGQPHEVIDR